MKKFLFFGLALLWSASVWAQWSTNTTDNLRVYGPGSIYIAESKLDKMTGNTWVFWNNPSSVDDVFYLSGNVQLLDKEGVKLIGENGIEVYKEPSNSAVFFGGRLFVDVDGNAIVASVDGRNGDPQSIQNTFLYKISPSGNNLWGEDGIATAPPEVIPYMENCQQLIQLEDKSYVYACQRMVSYDYSSAAIILIRFSEDGEVIDSTSLQSNGNLEYSYPYLYNAGNNQFIMVYSQDAVYGMYAQKYDFEFSSVWENPVAVNRDPLPSGSFPWTNWNVISDGKGGIIASYFKYEYSMCRIFVNRVKADGTFSFQTSDASGNVSTSNHEYLDFRYPAIDYDGIDEWIYLTGFGESPSSSWKCVYAQKVNANTGELMWSDTGKMIEPVSQKYSSFAGNNLKVDKESGNVMMGYGLDEYTSINDTSPLFFWPWIRFRMIDAEGVSVWKDEVVDVAKRTDCKTMGNFILHEINNMQAVFTWTDNREHPSDYYMKSLLAQNIRIKDGGMGNDDTFIKEENPKNNAALTLYPNPTTSRLCVQLQEKNIHNMKLFDITGKTVLVKNNIDTPQTDIFLDQLGPGIYFLKVEDCQGTTHIQKLVKQ